MPPSPAPHSTGLVTAAVADRPGVLLAVAQAVAAHTDISDLFRELAAALRKHLATGYLSFALVDTHAKSAKLQFLEPVGGGSAPKAADTPTELPADESPTARVYETQEPFWLNVDDKSGGLGVLRAALARQGVRVACFVPLSTPRRKLGAMGFASYAATTPSQSDLDFATQVGRLVALAVEAALTRRELERANARLAAEKLYLEEEIRTDRRTDAFIGDSPAIRAVLDQVKQVAPTDSAVLITGETGTGKELIARAIHRFSRRSDRTFVKLNCAAIPKELLESELFGHEKGAFTGALERRLGRFELADGGTLFLDEVGDIPAELQSKFLRVLQEREFERLGSGKTIKVNVRVVAATHRNLAKLVKDGTFREDLYYRLHVFPVPLPPLRERREDIPALVTHFVELFARRLGRTIDAVPAPALEALRQHSWPGNVRELEHLIERAVILTPGGELRVPMGDLYSATALAPPVEEAKPPRGTLRDNERELIRRTLEECKWIVGGPRGAAARLGIKRTTLISRMKKLGLTK